MSKIAKYVVVPNPPPSLPKNAVTIRDTGHPWDLHPTITNAAEEVVEELVKNGILRPGQRLFYFDSEGDLDELKVQDGRFAGFAPGPERTPNEQP